MTEEWTIACECGHPATQHSEADGCFGEVPTGDGYNTDCECELSLWRLIHLRLRADAERISALLKEREELSQRFGLMAEILIDADEATWCGAECGRLILFEHDGFNEVTLLLGGDEEPCTICEACYEAIRADRAALSSITGSQS